MIIHVCGSDGQQIGEFEEQDFLDSLFAGRFPADGYYWHDGMTDWQPISDYRALAKTQRISFAPPVRRTVKINLEPTSATTEKRQSSLRRFWKRLTGR